MARVFALFVLIGIPVVALGSFLNWSDITMFIISCVSIVGLSSYIGRATESLAIVSGPRIGGLLNATFAMQLNSLFRFLH